MRLLLVKYVSLVFQPTFIYHWYVLGAIHSPCAFLLWHKCVYKQDSYAEGEKKSQKLLNSQVFISSLYIPKPKKEMNLKFDSTQFKFWLPGEAASSRQDYKLGKVMLPLQQKNQKLKAQNQHWPKLGVTVAGLLP